MMQYLVGADTTAAVRAGHGHRNQGLHHGPGSGLTLTLGSVPVSLANMTQAYSVFASRAAAPGHHDPRDPRPQQPDRLQPRPGRTAADPPLTKGEAYLTHWILEGNTNPATNAIWGRTAQLFDTNGVRRHAGFKTGTTNDFRDVSGFGYVPGGLTVGVWMGNNNQEPLSNKLGQASSARTGRSTCGATS